MMIAVLASVFSGLFSQNAMADIDWVRFSFQFGSSTLDFDGAETTGTGYSATTELYMNKKWGYIINLGSSSTDTNEVNINGSYVRSLEVVNRYVQGGAFFFPIERLRIAAGPGVHFVDYELKRLNSSVEESATYLGPFASIGYRLPIEKIVLGAQYNYATFGENSQSDIFILIGAQF